MSIAPGLFSRWLSLLRVAVSLTGARPVTPRMPGTVPGLRADAGRLERPLTLTAPRTYPVGCRARQDDLCHCITWPGVLLSDLLDEGT